MRRWLIEEMQAVVPMGHTLRSACLWRR
jgi:hypothetical protein